VNNDTLKTLLLASSIIGPAGLAALLPRPRARHQDRLLSKLEADAVTSSKKMARAHDKRRHRQRERRRISLGGLPLWTVGTPGKDDWWLVAAGTERQALELHTNHTGSGVGDLTIKRAEWDGAIEHEPIVKEAKIVWEELDEPLPDGELARFGWGFWHDNDPECEECHERVESVQELSTPEWAMAVCRACYEDLVGAR
jgi:hypothetical protein